MGVGQAYTVIQMTPEDLKQFFKTTHTQQTMDTFLSQFDNVLVGAKDIAHFHSVNVRTVLNYIDDGLIIPEEKIKETDHHRFRLSYALKLDFKELRRKLTMKNKQLKS